MTTFTLSDLIGAVREVLDERGDGFRYQSPSVANPEWTGPTCVYSIDGETGSCLFGVALIEKLGVPYDPDWEERGIRNVLHDNVGLRYDWDDETVLEALADAQDNQDWGAPYGTVRRVFEDRLEAQA